ncbi:hypothetical protein [Paraburkholderia nodosa]|uniref:hypothetical protein n=1 Tax=Paraburkholderia nodosa TaxID=392320 RepID=UPI00210B2874|nr:hypothetical protein [Paraburkholderia nodosa]
MCTSTRRRIGAQSRRLKIRNSAPIFLQETKTDPAHKTESLRGSRVPQSQGKTNMFNTVRTIGVIAPLLFLTACAVVAPPYSPDVDNIQSLKNVTAAHAKVGAFDSQADAKNPYPVPLRANSLKSPVGNSFGAYLADAMTKELQMAGKLSPESDVEIKATLLENDIDVGVATGAARLSARFIVMRSGSVRYDQVKSAHTQWDSAFAAMIAVPKAREEYPLAVQKLLGELYADPAFIQAIQ